MKIPTYVPIYVDPSKAETPSQKEVFAELAGEWKSNTSVKFLEVPTVEFAKITTIVTTPTPPISQQLVVQYTYKGKTLFAVSGKVEVSSVSGPLTVTQYNKMLEQVEEVICKKFDLHPKVMVKVRYAINVMVAKSEAKNDKGEEVSVASRRLPAAGKVVEYPCECENHDIVWSVVQHLNDQHDWTREKIADWIDELHDAGVINAEFQPWGEDEPEESPDDNTKFWNEIGYTSYEEWTALTYGDTTEGMAQHTVVMDKHGNITNVPNINTKETKE